MTSPELQAAISTRLLIRIIIALIAIWSLISGLVLVAFHGASTGALGAGVSDRTAQRLFGAHLLVLTPAYLLIAWRPERYEAFAWLPFAAQLATVLTVGYSILIGDTDFSDGILAVAVGAIFVALLSFVWVTERRTVARNRLAEVQEQQGAAVSNPSAGDQA